MVQGRKIMRVQENLSGAVYLHLPGEQGSVRP